MKTSCCVACFLIASVALLSQRPVETVAQEQQQPDPQRKMLTSEQQREFIASIYLRRWAEADARANGLREGGAYDGSVPIFREYFDDHYKDYYRDNPALRAAAQEAAITADDAKRRLVRMGADAAPALASARLHRQIMVRDYSDKILNHLGSGALKSLIRSATDAESPNRIASYLEVRNRFPLAEISSDAVFTSELLELLKQGTPPGCQTVIQELATRKSDATAIIPVLLKEEDGHRLRFASVAFCYLGASSQDILTLVKRGLIQSPADYFVHLGAAMSVFERGEVTEAELRTMISELRTPNARSTVDNELTQCLKHLAQSQVNQKPEIDRELIQRQLLEFKTRPFKPDRLMSPYGEFSELSPVFHRLVHWDVDVAIRTEVAKSLVEALERGTRATRLMTIAKLGGLETAAWPLAPLMIELVKNKNRDIDDLMLGSSAMTLMGAMGDGDFPERNTVLTTLSEVLHESSGTEVNVPARCKKPDKYRLRYVLARYSAVASLGRLKPSDTVVDEVLRPLLPATNQDNRERMYAAEAILKIKGYDEDAIKALRSLAGDGLLAFVSPIPNGITKWDQVEIRRTIEDWTAKKSGKTVELLIQRLVANAGGSMEAEKIIHRLGMMGPEAHSAIPILERALTCPDGNLRGDAVLALARIDPANPHIRNVLPDLLRAAESNVRQHAREARRLIEE
jgi:hypothetical protein